MNMMERLKRICSALALISAFALGGCSADGNPADIPGWNDDGNGGIDVLEDCAAPVAAICVLGGDGHPGGLVDILLDENGPLGPIAGAINTDSLVDALTELLANNDGSLTSLGQGLLVEGQLQAGLQNLLLGENLDGNGGLGLFIEDLLAETQEGQGLIELFGQGVPGLLQALLIDGTSSTCLAPLGTLCLIAGEDAHQQGLVDLLLTSDGALGKISPTLTTLATDDLVAILGETLQSNGSLEDLVTGLFEDGNLATGLQNLFLGQNLDGQGGLVEALDGLLSGGGTIIEDIIDFIGGLFGPR